MSGGAFNYCYSSVADAARYAHDPEIRALLKDLADLLYEEEWYHSGDTGKEDYENALRDFKKKWFGGTDARLVRVAELTGRIYREACEAVNSILLDCEAVNGILLDQDKLGVSDA